MKIRLTISLIAVAALSGCATYDYAGGSAPGGYYVGRAAPVQVYGPYYGGYGYGGQVSLGYGWGSFGPYGYSWPYYGYGGYGGYYPHPNYRPYHPRPPVAPHYPGSRPQRPPGQEGQPPPWRAPNAGYRDPERGRGLLRAQTVSPGLVESAPGYPDRAQIAPPPQRMQPPPQRMERASPPERVQEERPERSYRMTEETP
ncbi:MAG: hypothetical protein LH491_03205 [Pseudoxanthomonas sp.]|nr:hypothetical protein [Pseudoxanthomonas sp.]